MVKVLGKIKCPLHGMGAVLVVQTPDGVHFARCGMGHEWLLHQSLLIPCSVWFRAFCEHSSTGGRDSFVSVGYQLMRGALMLIEGAEDPYLVSPFKQSARDRLEVLELDRDSETLSAWFEDYLPLWIGLIPDNRLESFLRGCWAAFDAGEVF